VPEPEQMSILLLSHDNLQGRSVCTFIKRHDTMHYYVPTEPGPNLAIFSLVRKAACKVATEEQHPGVRQLLAGRERCRLLLDISPLMLSDVRPKVQRPGKAVLYSAIERHSSFRTHTY